LVDGNVARLGRSAGAVNEAAAANHEIVHGEIPVVMG